MNIENIKHIIDSDIPDKVKEQLIINELALDKNSLSMMMKILDAERKFKSELIDDLNLELSRAHVYIETVKETTSAKHAGFNKQFVLDQIAKFYETYKGKIQHCFNRFID